MDKIKSLKYSLTRYLIPCFAACGIGTFLIKAILHFFLRWYDLVYLQNRLSEFFLRSEKTFMYIFLSYAEYLFVPLWTVVCLWFTVRLFYNREIKEPVDVLTNASKEILSDNLDFKVECRSENEIGMLCVSFEEMRKNLYDSNYQLWKSLEEKKRLNSAFSHDLRTPITVLKGYSNLINQFSDSISTEKKTEIMSKMSGQIERLEHYTEKMSCLHKMEDIIPGIREFSYADLCRQIDENGTILCGNIKFEFSSAEYEEDILYTDEEIVIQVFMNLITNAVRYAENKIECSAEISDDMLKITVSDDGSGFSDTALRKAWQPFYREGDENDKEHFGLGLYICRLLCRKTGGDIFIENNEKHGGKVSAAFSVKNPENQIKS